MRRVYTLILLMFFGYSMYSQQREVVIIIDTINFLAIDKLEQFQVAAVNNSSVDDDDFTRRRNSEYVTERKISNEKYPNFVGSIILSSDSSFIEISLDTFESKLQITALKLLNEDTLRIQKIEQINPCYNDTILTKIWYYRVYNDSLAQSAHKFKEKRKIIKAKCKSLNSAKNIIINKQRYSVVSNMSKIITTGHISGHGYKPLKKYDRLTRKNGNLDGRGISKYYFKRLEVKYYKLIRINLIE